jgi:hypothetical protein
MRWERGRLVKTYIPRPLVGRVQQMCAEWQRAQSLDREYNRQMATILRNANCLLRKLETQYEPR